MNEITKQYIRENLNADVPTLALRKAPVGIDVSLALKQIEARQLLSKKVPEWSQNENLLFPAHLSIEQCSSEATARYKASLMHGVLFADLTGGLGVDCHFISKHFQQSEYVEQNPELCELAKHNFQTLGDDVIIHNTSAEEYLNQGKTVDYIYLDPARRDSYGRKTVSIADCSPNVIHLQDMLLHKAHRVIIKLSPMLDISKALEELRHVCEVHIVAVANECKELLFVLDALHSDKDPIFTCVNLQSGQRVEIFTQNEEQEAVAHSIDSVLNYLYEPNVAIMKGGCYKLLTQRYGIQKLHPNSHLYTSEQLVPDFPGRCFKVEGWAPFNKRIKKDFLQDIDQANLAVRNFPISVDDLRKTLKLKDGGEVYLFATTLLGGEKVVIKTKKSAF